MDTATNTHKTEFQKTTFENGLRVVTSEVAHARSVSIGILIGVGSRYESDELAGISHFVEHMVFKGTRRRPLPGEISGVIEGVGGVLNAGTEQELTVFWCMVPESHLHESLDLLFDMLREPLFDPESIEKERLVVFEELRMINDHPNYKVDALIDEMLWPGHPLGRDIGGTEESVAGITREGMLEYMAASYHPGNIVVCAAGKLVHSEVVGQVESLSKGWPGGSPAGWAPVTHQPQAPQVRVEYRSTEQTHLSIAVPGLSVRHPDRYALDLLSVVLGEGMSSRLFVELRETRGLAYDVHSGVAHFMDSGAFVITAGVDPKRVYEAVQTIMDQVGQLKDGTPEEELEKAKRLVTGRLLLRLEDTGALANWIGTQELLMGEIADLDDVIDDVNGVSVEDVRKVANDLLIADRLNMAVVGPCRGQRRLERLLKL